MLLQAAFLVAAGFSHTVLRRPCANAACQLPQPRAAVCAAADAENNDARARLETLWALPSENELESELKSAGGDVWASKDLRSFADGKLVVRKHTKGELSPGSKPDPMESLLAEPFLVEWDHLVDGESDDYIHPGFMKVTADMLVSREPPLPGGFTRGDVWATRDVTVGQNNTVAVKKHTKGSLLGPSVDEPTERLLVSWEHRADGEDENIGMRPSALTSHEPPLPGGFTRGDVWATSDLKLKDQDIITVKKHTKGSLLGPSADEPTERLVVSWEHRADGEAGTTHTYPGQLTSHEPPLPGGFTRGYVWATADVTLKDQDIVAVKKHTKGSLLGPSVDAPTERLLVSWEHRADGEAGNINTYPGMLTSREPPLPGGFIRGDVWATSDLLLHEEKCSIMLVKKHTKGSLLGPSETDPTRLLVEWEHRDDIGKAGKTTVSFDWLTSQEPLPGGFTRGDVVWATSDLPLVKPLGGQGSKMVMVKKHTKGAILGLPEADPTQLLVSWEDRDDTGKAESLTAIVSPDKLTSREPR